GSARALEEDLVCDALKVAVGQELDVTFPEASARAFGSERYLRRHELDGVLADADVAVADAQHDLRIGADLHRLTAAGLAHPLDAQVVRTSDQLGEAAAHATRGVAANLDHRPVADGLGEGSADLEARVVGHLFAAIASRRDLVGAHHLHTSKVADDRLLPSLHLGGLPAAHHHALVV